MSFLVLLQDLKFSPSPSRIRSMDSAVVQCLVNSISRFIHLVTYSTLKSMPTLNEFRNVALMLKHLKSLLDNAVDHRVSSDGILCRECEELDITVNEAREYLEQWSPKMSNILCVLQSGPLLLKLRNSLLQISQTIYRFSDFSPSIKNESDDQHDHIKLEKVLNHIEESLGRQREGKSPCSEDLITVIESLKLAAHLELLNESIALEKERIKAEDSTVKQNIGLINQVIDLMSHIRDCMVKLESFNSINGIKIPPYFRCPLSLELMLEPVIVASGQTYERGSIQRWLDHGLKTCPKTRQELSHINLIPNFTVKALIENWSEENKIKLHSTADCPSSISIQSHSKNASHVGNFQSSSHNENLSSEFSVEAGDNSDKKACGSYEPSQEEFHGLRVRETEKSDHSSTHSYVHSRSESTSSAVSSIDYLPSVSPNVSGMLNGHYNTSDASGESTSDFSPVFDKNRGYSSLLSGRQYHSSKTMAEISPNENHNPSRTFSFSSESRFNDLTTSSHVEELIEDLQGSLIEAQMSAAAELRFLAKHNTENRLIIGNNGAIAPLLALLLSEGKLIQEHAVTALLNLSINEKVKLMIAEAGALEPLVHVLRTGNAGAKENAAACLFSLSVLEEYRIKIGHSGAVKELVNLLGSGTIRGKKDAATALFNLSIYHDNKARIVQAGAVKYLVELLDPVKEMIDKAVALLANLSTITEGSSAIAREGGIPPLVEVVETGSQRGKENAASILLQLCINNSKYCRLVLQEGAVPPLVALSQSGTMRGKEKAQQLLSHFRTQREGTAGRGKS